MNPWLFIHSLWVRDPRDRAHLKALWARDERQRGLMRWLVLLALPALVWAGVIESREDLSCSLLFSCFALCHIWTCEDAREAEFEACLPVRSELRLQVQFLGALLPMLFITILIWRIRVEVLVSEEWPGIPLDRGESYWFNSLALVIFAVALLTAFNRMLRHRLLRLPAHFMVLFSLTIVANIKWNALQHLPLLVGSILIWVAVNFSVRRPEVPSNAVEDFLERKSRRHLLIVIAILLIPAIMALFAIGASVLWLTSKASEWSHWSAEIRRQMVLILYMIAPISVGLPAYLLIRFRVICRRYFLVYIVLLLLALFTLLYRSYSSITNAPGGF